jgi:hypothetical protein
VEGVIYYEPQFVRVTYEFSIRLDEAGKIVGSADNKTCVAVIQKEEIQVRPDYDRARVLLNRPGPLAMGKLSVVLADGMLQSINSESASKGPELITAISAAISAVAKDLAVQAPPSGDIACNAGPRIKSFSRIYLGA